MAKLSKTLKDAYKSYPHNITKRDPFFVENTEFREICVAANRIIMDKCMQGDVFLIPHYLGDIFVRKKKIPMRLQKRQVDHRLSKLHKKTIYHNNNHSDQFYAKWTWDKKKTKLSNKFAYNFKAVRKNNRLLAKNIKINNTINNYLS